MLKKRSFYILLGITVLMVVAAVLSQRPANEFIASHGLQSPDLGDRVDTVRKIVIRSSDNVLRLERVDDGWVARNKDDYPADAARVRELVLGLSRLQRLERKTSDPEKLARLELTDVDEPGSRAVEVTLLTGDDVKVASVLVGKLDDFQSSDYSRYFVRDAGDPQSWLVQGSLPPVLEDVGSWLERRLLPGIGGTDLQSVTVTHPDGETVVIRRDSSEAEDFELAGLSEGEEIDNQYSINMVAETFQRLSLKDVKADESAETGEAVVTVSALTFNGVRIVARFNSQEPDYGLRLSAAYEPEHDRSGGGGGEDNDVNGEQLAGDLNQRWRDRLFVVSQYSLDSLIVRQSDLIKAAEETPAETGAD